MFEYSRWMYQVEGPTWKWKMGKNEADSGIQRLQEGGIVDAGGNNLTLGWIVCLELVGVNICPIRCSADVQHGIRGLGVKFL